MPIYGQSQRQFLFDAINAQNPNAITPAEFENAQFGKPTAIYASNDDDPNTEITLQGRQGRGYMGVQTYRYRRLSLGDIFKNITVTITHPLAFGNLFEDARRKAFAQNLNARYGLNVEMDDIPKQYVAVGRENGIGVSKDCIQYTGSFSFNSSPGPLVLEESVLDKILDTLNHPISPTTGKLCAPLLTYGHDLTDEPQITQALVAGRLDVGPNESSGATTNLLNVLTARGLPSFDTRGATIVLTTPADEPRANPMFDNVLVISNVNDEKIGGDWLLHYNN